MSLHTIGEINKQAKLCKIPTFFCIFALKYSSTPCQQPTPQDRTLHWVPNRILEKKTVVQIEEEWRRGSSCRLALTITLSIVNLILTKD